MENEGDKNAEFKRAFNIFDKDQDGLISTKELKTIMFSLGYNPTNEEINELIRKYDKDESGSIDVDEFMDLMNNKLKEKEQQEQLIEDFQIFDRDCDGVLSIDDLAFMYKSIGETLDESEIELLKKKGHLDVDNCMSFQEFRRIMTEEN